MKLTISDVPPSLREWPYAADADSLCVACTIPGEPLSKQRPRFSGKHVYTPQETRRAQETVGLFIRSTHKSIVPNEQDQFSVRLSFYLGTGQRRDLDNMCKLVIDACTGLVWKDDLQVMEIFARQSKFEAVPRTEVVICSLGPLQKLTAECGHCGKIYKTYRSWGKRGFCSRECQVACRYSSTLVNCSCCGKEIRREKKRIAEAKRFYCSPECKKTAETVSLICAECGKTFTRAKSLLRGPGNHRYCSLRCRVAFTRKVRAKNACGICSQCGGETTKREYRKCFRCARKQRHTIIELEAAP